MGRSGLGSDVEGEKQNLVKLNVNNLGQESENVSNNLESSTDNQIDENVNAENRLRKEKPLSENENLKLQKDEAQQEVQPPGEEITPEEKLKTQSNDNRTTT